jgi:hypothetical protein
MRIKQCWLATPLKHSGRFVYFRKINKLKKYHSRRQPVVFYGLYTTVDLSILKKHRSTVIVVWGGSDVLRNKNVKAAVKKNVKHVAISSFISDDLTKMGIEHKTIPLIASPVKPFKISPLGNEIYTYIPSSSRKFYGNHIVKQIKKKCKFKINVISSSSKYNRKQLAKIYSRCFCGLRLTPHDGVANTVIEMGLMGRKCIYNGKVPNAISWSENDIDGIVENIYKESLKIGTVNLKLRQEMEKYLDVGREWLDTKYWE